MQTQEKSFLLLKYCFLKKYCYFALYKQFTCKRSVSQCIRKCTEFTRISTAALINFFLQKCGAYLRAELNTMVIPLSTVFTRISAAALINSPPLPQCGAYSSTYCNWQLKSLLHLGQNVITFRLLLHLGLLPSVFVCLSSCSTLDLHLGAFGSVVSLSCLGSETGIGSLCGSP